MNRIDAKPQTDNVEQAEMDISVIVPFYNAEKHIEECAKALFDQTYPSERYEIVMVDNNSTDSSAEIVRKYPRIKLLSEKKQGSYAARNSGVAASKGAIIAFTDADCEASADWLQKITASFRSPEVEVVQGSRRYSNESSALVMLAAFESERAAYTFSGRSNGIYYGYTNNMAVRRDLFERCGPFLEVMRGADSIFVNRVIEEYSFEVIRYAPDASIRHLELTNVWNYFLKRFIYGKSLQQSYSVRKKSQRNVTFAEHSELLRKTIRKNNYSALQSFSLITLIWTGNVFFTLGRLAVKFGLP